MRRPTVPAPTKFKFLLTLFLFLVLLHCLLHYGFSYFSTNGYIPSSLYTHDNKSVFTKLHADRPANVQVAQNFWSDILVLALFIQPHPFTTERRQLLELYRLWLPQMIFSGPASVADVPYYFPCQAMKWLYWYDCIAQVLELAMDLDAQHEIKGLFVFHFDELFLPQKLATFDKTKVWMSQACDATTGNLSHLHRPCQPLHMGTYPKGYDWANWGQWPNFVNATLQLPASLHREPYIGKYALWLCWCDLFYIPSKIFPDFAKLARHYYKYEVMSEVAVPTILYGLQSPADRGREGCRVADMEYMQSGDFENDGGNGTVVQHQYDLSKSVTREQFVMLLLGNGRGHGVKINEKEK